MKTRRINRAIAIVLVIAAMMVAFGATAVQATETATKTVGTIEKNAEFVREALAEKALAAKATAVKAEPVVEGATGAVETAVQEATIEEETEETFEPVHFEVEEAEETILPVATVQATVVEEETEVQEATVEYTVNSMADEAIEEDDEFIAESASTDTASATVTAVTTIDSTVEETQEVGMAVEFAETEVNYTAENANATRLGLPNGKSEAFTVVGNNTLRQDGGQSLIDKGQMICYPSCDMTQGVKYFAGHNPGIMRHMVSIQVGSVVRLSNGEGFQDYKIVEIVQGAKGLSFDQIKFKKSGTNLWNMLTRGTENAVVVQFCRNGVNTFHYGIAL